VGKVVGGMDVMHGIYTGYATLLTKVDCMASTLQGTGHHSLSLILSKSALLKMPANTWRYDHACLSLRYAKCKTYDGLIDA